MIPFVAAFAAFALAHGAQQTVLRELTERFTLGPIELARIAATAAWAYALSAPFNGLLSDRFGARRAGLAGTAGAAAASVLLGMLFLLDWQTRVYAGLSVTLAVARYFAAFGTPILVKAGARRLCGRPGAIGALFGATAAIGAGVSAAGGGWPSPAPSAATTFLLPALAALAAFACLVATKPNADDNVAHAWDARALGTRALWITAAAQFCAGLAAHGLLLSYPAFLHEALGVTAGAPPLAAGAVFIAAGGAAGAAFAGQLTDGRLRGSWSLGAAVALLCQPAAFWLLARTRSPWASGLALALAAAALFSARGLLTGGAAAALGGQRGAGVVAGFIEAAHALSGLAAGALLPSFLGRFGWGAWPLMLAPFSAAAAALALAAWASSPSDQPKDLFPSPVTTR